MNDNKEIYVVALPGAHVRVQWIHADGSIEREAVYVRHPQRYDVDCQFGISEQDDGDFVRFGSE